MTTDAAAAFLTKDDLLARLRAKGINFSMVRHPPVHTVEEAMPHWTGLDGLHTKNLFLKDAKDQLWLVAAPTDRDLDMKRLAGQIGSKRLSFAKEDLLISVLGVRQGAVSPLALINDVDHRVRLVLDAALAASPKVTFHPLANTATIALGTDDLIAVLKECGHEPDVVALDAVPE